MAGQRVGPPGQRGSGIPAAMDPEIVAAAAAAQRSHEQANGPIVPLPMNNFQGIDAEGSHESFGAEAERETGVSNRGNEFAGSDSLAGNFVPDSPAARAAMEQDRLLGLQQQAAMAGMSVSQVNTFAQTRAIIAQEKRYLVTVAMLEPDERVVKGWINGVPYEVPIGTWNLPYSIVAALVCQGRTVPPRECPELMVHALSVQHSKQRNPITAALASGQHSGAYLGESANGLGAMDLPGMREMVQGPGSIYAPLQATFGGRAL